MVALFFLSQTPVIILLIILVIRESAQNKKVAEKSIPPSTGISEEIEMTGPNKPPNYNGIVHAGSNQEDTRADVTKEVVVFVTTFTAFILFLYDGLQVWLTLLNII